MFVQLCHVQEPFYFILLLIHSEKEKSLLPLRKSLTAKNYLLKYPQLRNDFGFSLRERETNLF